MLKGKTALVTGATSGIGLAIARALAADGHHLTLLGRRLDALQALAATLPGTHHCAAANVADEAQVQSAFDSARAALGPVWGLVNNAGQAESAPLHRTSTELWQRMLAVNLTGRSRTGRIFRCVLPIKSFPRATPRPRCTTSR